MKKQAGKRILSLFLTLVMLFTMCPITVSAATDLTVSGGTITLPSGITLGPLTLTKAEIYTQSGYNPVPVESAVMDGTTIDVVLAKDTDPSLAIMAGFSAANTGQFMLSTQSNTNKCTLSNGVGQMEIGLAAMSGGIRSLPKAASHP